ncbi:MAG: hypothetical protein ACHQHN_12210 [Sphingobacteriales bacterium]
MTKQTKTVPREAITGIASGLMLMAVFTMMWACIANVGLGGKDHHVVLIVFCPLASTFFFYGIQLFLNAKKFLKSASESDIAEKKKAGMWFGIIFGAEGLFIFIAVNVVINLGYPELVIPAIALVVGLHFYPMAKIFRRKIDYYLATWATLIALLGFVLSLNKTLTEPGVLAFVGVGIAIATSGYGLYMIYEGRRLTKPVLEKA